MRGQYVEIHRFNGRGGGCRAQQRKSGPKAASHAQAQLPDHWQLMTTESAYFHMRSVE